MFGFIRQYTHWLHGRWPAGQVESLPEVADDGSTNVPGVYIVGDLKGVPLLKFSVDSGTKAVRTIHADRAFQSLRAEPGQDAVDIAILGGGLSGMAAAKEAKKLGLSFVLLEASEPFSTIINFPRAKPIYTYPKDMNPAGDLTVTAAVKETLVDELRGQTADLPVRASFAECVERNGKFLRVRLRGEAPLTARRVIVAIGRSGNYRRLGVPGEGLDKVTNRLHDPKDFAGKKCLVVGGGDSALETAIALAESGAHVTLSYRQREFSRAKPENIERTLALASQTSLSPRILLESSVEKIEPRRVLLKSSEKNSFALDNDAVFTMIGREAPLPFFRRSGIRIHGEWTGARFATLFVVLLASTFLYHWKKTGIGGFDQIPFLRSVVRIGDTFAHNGWFPYNIPSHLSQGGSALAQTLRITLGEPGFYYSLAYTLLIVIFGIRRILRRKTRYVALQTAALTAVQVLPLFLLPYIVLPWLGHAGAFDGGVLAKVADALFPRAGYGHGREYWRSFGLVLAWPLFFWNVFTGQPLWTWLAISFVQTFIVIPAIIYFWGKGAYCGWICSCGALAETLGDAHRAKMPHGPGWNRLNMAGQVILAAAFLLLAFRVLGWMHVRAAEAAFNYIFHDMPVFNYAWFVDLFLAGIIGVGLYFHFSGRVWCRFFCPLAALMHIYARFSRFGIVAEKKKCISCNVCTSVCHMGIDVMNFANKGLTMQDPECVRCSACVQSCPTGVLNFGQIDKSGRVIRIDAIAASPVQVKEK